MQDKAPRGALSCVGEKGRGRRRRRLSRSMQISAQTTGQVRLYALHAYDDVPFAITRLRIIYTRDVSSSVISRILADVCNP